MFTFQPRQWLALSLFLGVASAQTLTQQSVTTVIGEDENAVPSSVGWTDGVCYKPIVNSLHPGDTLEFVYSAHNVYQMASKEHFMDCNFTDATLLSQVGESPFRYTIPADFLGNLYFACQVGDHCASGTQKVQATVSPFFGNGNDRIPAVSSYLVGVSTDDCQQLQEDAANGEIADEAAFMDNQRLQSNCSEPVLGEDGFYTRTCLSGPATLTPGGVINRLFVMHYPYPRDHRVAIGQRTFEFVYDNVDGEGVIPAPVNQLYVHHLSGRIVFGQGAEGIRQEAPDAPFPQPYTVLSGDEGEFMIFHIIDLREVDDWLGCIECRCPISSGKTYFDELTQTGNITGGVNCCSNCTDLEGPTLDYRMRYNVSYRELDDETPIKDVQMLTADISPAVDKVLEHDVFSWEYLPENEKDEEHPYIQRLVREEPFNQMFKDEFFQNDYSGPDEVQLLRCVAHLHVASIDMWLEDMETGEKLCDGQTFYGKDPETDEGFLIAVNVDTHDPPLTFPADRMVRFVTEYNATQVHTGVMGYWFVFVAGQNELTHKNVNLTVDMCLQPTCDVNLLPSMDMSPFETAPAATASQPAITARQGGNPPTGDCVDTIESSPVCTFGGLCDCEAFVNAEESTGCDGFYSSPMGDMEVRSVCANYCGCDVTIAIEEATSGTGEDCVDTLSSNPACTFGGLCDCETFVNSEESTGCGGVYTSPMGDIQINSVCANYCGCEGNDTAEVAEPAMDCVDTLADSPSCQFGGLCDCEVFVNAEESTGCNGVYSSTWGDVQINDVCANYCGCPEGSNTDNMPPPPAAVDAPEATGGASPGCENKLVGSPMCRFAGICECEDFVNAPESEGCGGLYKSEMGDVVINDVCAQYCDACGSMEEIFEEAYTEIMTAQLREKCQYATPECQAMLSNVYSCGAGASGIEQAHPMVRNLLEKKGQQVAMESTMLGDSSLHAGQELPVELPACPPEGAMESGGSSTTTEEAVEKNGEKEEEALDGDASGAARFLSGLVAALVVAATSMLL